MPKESDLERIAKEEVRWWAEYEKEEKRRLQSIIQARRDEKRTKILAAKGPIANRLRRDYARLLVKFKGVSKREARKRAQTYVASLIEDSLRPYDEQCYRSHRKENGSGHVLLRDDAGSCHPMSKRLRARIADFLPADLYHWPDPPDLGHLEGEHELTRRR